MAAPSPDVDRFILEEIDTVPHLEALLLLWRHAPETFSAEQVAGALYVHLHQANDILEDLQRRGLISRADALGSSFSFNPHPEDRTGLMQAVDTTYRSELIRISGLIHSKASPGLRAFAHAFRFRKDRS